MAVIDLSCARKALAAFDRAAEHVSSDAAAYLRNYEIPCLESLPARLDTDAVPRHYIDEVIGHLSGPMIIAGHSLPKSAAVKWAKEDGLSEAFEPHYFETLAKMRADGVTTALRTCMSMADLEELAVHLRSSVNRLIDCAVSKGDNQNNA